MKVPATNTTTTAGSAQSIQVEKKSDAAVSNQGSTEQTRVNGSEAKGSQALAEDSKASHKLQEGIQRNQLQQQFGGMPGAKTTTTSTTGPAKKEGASEGSSVQNLDQLLKKENLDAGQIASLKEFAKKSGVPEKDLLKVAANDRYKGAEKTEAMKAYAIAFDAANNGKLSPERAQNFKEHVLPNLMEGKIGIQLKDMDGARAQYNGRNEGNKPGYEPNTMSLPKEGLNLKSQEDRAVLVHESQHIVQDSSKKEMTFMESEKDGHATYADYKLRDSGAIKDTPEGTKLDYEKFSKVLSESNEAPDRKSVVDQFVTAAEKNVSKKRPDLNGSMKEISNDVGEFIRSSTHGTEKDFETLYIQSLKNNNPKYAGKSESEIRQTYNQSAPKDGL